MGKPATVSAEISDAMDQTVREAVDVGDFQSAEDVVRHALTEWRIAERMPRIGRDDLTSMLLEGLEGPGIPMDEVFDRLEAKYTAMAEARERGD